MHFIRDHERGIEAKSEMADDLIRVCLALILLQELARSGKCDLRNVFLDFFLGHTDTVVDEFQCLIIRIDDYMNLILRAHFRSELADALKFSEFCYGIAGICYLLAHKDIMIRVKPFLNDRQHVFAVNG